MKREGQLWIKIFPDKAYHQKSHLKFVWVREKEQLNTGQLLCKPGRILFEVGGVPLDVAKEALRLAAQKVTS
jgi:large subunit ribosomal protein L16